MRTSTLANMLLLCGLTAATAAMASGVATPQATNNSMTTNAMMLNDVMDSPTPANETTPAPAPSPTPGVAANALSPKPM